MPPLPEAIRRVLAPCAPRFSHRVWLHAQGVLWGAMRAPGARPVTAAWRVMGLAAERHVTTSHRVLNRAPGATRPGSRLRLGVRITLLVPPGASIGLGADDTVDRWSGRQRTAPGGEREAVRSSQTHSLRCFGLQGGARMRLVPGPWSRRVWARPLGTAVCWPAEHSPRRRHQTRVDGVRHLRTQGRRWRPGRQRVVVVDGGFAAVLLALACGKPHVSMGSRWRWDAALYHPPALPPKGKGGPTPLQGQRQRRLQAWAERADTPWETVAVDWYGG